MPILTSDILFLDGTLAAILGVVILIAWIVGLVDIIGRRPDFDRTKRLAWILLVVILPIFGTILYFVLRRSASIEADPA